MAWCLSPPCTPDLQMNLPPPVRSLGSWVRLLPSNVVSRSDLKVFQDGHSANAMLSLADVDKPCLYPWILLI